MRRFDRGEAYDEQPMPDLDPEAIDFRVASELLAPVRKLRRTDLQTLRLVTSHQGRRVPTVGGLLLFGKQREEYFPDAWIQVGRFQGVDRSRILDRAEIRTYLVGAVDEAIAFVEKHAVQGVEIGRLRRRERWNVPPVAVREAIVNAVVHADYAQRGTPIRLAIFDDRVEIENPGLLPFGLTLEDLPRGISNLLNRVIGRALHPSGSPNSGEAAFSEWPQPVAAGLARPKLEEIGTRFRVTLGLGRIGPPTLDETDEAILGVLREGAGWLTSEIAQAIDLTPRATRTRLLRLVERGLVREVGSSPQDPKRRYFQSS